MKTLLKLAVCSLLVGCCMGPVSLYAQDDEMDSGNVLSNEEIFSGMEDEPVVESGEIVKVYADENTYMELDAAYVDSSTILDAKINISKNAAVVIPGITYYKTVTVTKSIASFSSTIVYSEYNDHAQAWYKGTLALQSMVRKGSVYVATYSGFLLPQN